MANLTPVQVLDILAKRMEARAAVLERVGLVGMEPVIHELRQFAAMVRRAMDYLEKG
jgi:hypothetical protein